MTSAAKPTKWQCPDWRLRLFGTIVFGIAIVILFRDLLLGCIDRWIAEPQYSHGFVIPVMALGLGWFSSSINSCMEQLAAVSLDWP